MNSKVNMNDDSNNNEADTSRTKQVADEITADLKRKLADEGDDTFESLETVEEGMSNVVETYENEINKLKDQLLRAVADAENVRKRAERDIADSRKYAVTGFARELLSVSENMQMALDSISAEARKADENFNNLAAGIEMTAQELLRVFENHGIKRIDPKGERFDHNFHQAVAQIEDTNHEPGTVVQVLQAGYVIQNRLLRPAMVTVSKAPSGAGNNDTAINTKA